MWQNPDSSSYFDLRAKLRRKMQQDGLLHEKIRVALISAYEQALSSTQVVLSRPERDRLFHQLAEDILTELINENKASHG
jgi:hypothetical protein